MAFWTLSPRSMALPETEWFMRTTVPVEADLLKPT
jgi:hypothetical protein